MSIPLHLNLLKEEEYLSSSPIRLRVMLPMLALLSALSAGVWWSVLATRLHAMVLQQRALENTIAQLKPAHERVLALRAEERELEGNLQQLRFYQNARITFGTALEQLAHHTPAKLQLTELHILPPPDPPPPDPKKPLFGPTNRLEEVTLRLAGRTLNAQQVETLLKTLQSPAFTNLIRAAEIPKGAYRQDTSRRGSDSGTLLFELICTCAPRSFE